MTLMSVKKFGAALASALVIAVVPLTSAAAARPVVHDARAVAAAPAGGFHQTICKAHCLG
ncbi:hypothetical protein GCM10010430_67860 [Kitasatospora cystarginea]|uniref:Uncharacterized protein n=2 Tax=Streptomycetaceae TaxID=2062 RepID=A0ABP5RRJ6_9ACTN